MRAFGSYFVIASLEKGKTKMASENSIADFFADRSVFITGSTGFVGKVLVEKLLRACPKIKRLYLLMRTSSSKDIATRRRELINNQVLFPFVK